MLVLLTIVGLLLGFRYSILTILNAIKKRKKPKQSVCWMLIFTCIGLCSFIGLLSIDSQTYSKTTEESYKLFEFNSVYVRELSNEYKVKIVKDGKITDATLTSEQTKLECIGKKEQPILVKSTTEIKNKLEENLSFFLTFKIFYDYQIKYTIYYPKDGKIVDY